MNKKIIYVALGVLALVGLYYFLVPASAPQPIAAKMFEYVVTGSEVVSGPEVMQVNEGDTLTIRIKADANNKLHVHGYDHEIDINADEWSELKFPANTAGRFAVELHATEMEIATLEVLPRQ